MKKDTTHSLDRVQRESWMNVVAKGLGVFCSFLLLILLARTMTAEAFAQFTVILAWLGIATVIASFSMPMIVVRFVAENVLARRFGDARGVVQFSIVLTLFSSAILSMLVAIAVHFEWIDFSGHLSDSKILFIALLPVNVMLVVGSGFLQGLKRVVAAELLASTLRPICMIAAIGVVWVMGKQATVSVVTHAYLLASIVSLVLLGLFTSRVSPRQMFQEKPIYSVSNWFQTAIGFAGILIASAIHERIDILVMDFTSSPAQVAVYAVAVRFAQTVILAITAVAVVMAPRLIERLDDVRAGNIGEVQALVRQTAWITVAVSTLAFVTFYFFAPLFLRVLGAHYRDAIEPILILVGCAILTTSFGPALVVATFCAQTRIALCCISLGIIVNASFNFLLVPRFGAPGAAISTSLGYLCMAISAHVWIYKRLGINTSIFPRRPGLVRELSSS